MTRHHFKIISKILTRADLLLIVIIFISAFTSYYILHNSGAEKSVYVYVKGELIRKEALTEDQKIIELSDGISIEIGHHKVRMLTSTCPHKICVKQGWSDDLPIVCVPNQILLVIKSGKAEDKMLITS